MADRKRKLSTVIEHKDEKFVSKGWGDFDHSQKFSLGVRGSTWTVRDKETSEKFVLQSCHHSAWTVERYKLLRMGRKWTKYLVSPRFMFFRKDWVYVCSELEGVCLAEIIDGTISITEAETATVVLEVIKILQALAKTGIWYCVTASNIFITEDGHVRLASFGRRVEPRKIENHHGQLNCQAVGLLVYHMLTRLPKIDEADFEPWEQMMTVRTRSTDIPVSIDHQLSAGFFDFIEACMGGSDDFDALSNHAFLNSPSSIAPLVRHTADTSLMGHHLRTLSCGKPEAGQKQMLEAKHAMGAAVAMADGEWKGKVV